VQQARRAFKEHHLPLALAWNELPPAAVEFLRENEPVLSCESFVQAQLALHEDGVAAVLPTFLSPAGWSGQFMELRLPALQSCQWS
jgi:hypothetical protein